MKNLMALTATLLSAGLHAQSLSPMPSACDGPSDYDNMLESLVYSLAGQLNTGYVDIYTPFSDNPNAVPNAARRRDFVSEAARASMNTRRIVIFGDAHGAEKHVVPQASASVKALFTRADLVVGNLESPLTYDEKPDMWGTYGAQSFNFHMTQAYVKGFAASLGIRPGTAVFSVANNHANDKDRWLETLASIDILRGTRDPSTGNYVYDFTGVDLDSSRPPAVTVANLRGVKVGVLGWAHFVNSGASSAATPWLTDERMLQRQEPFTGLYLKRDYRQMKADNGVKMLIGMPHWDCQIYSYPHAETIAQADRLLKQGMDLIVGAHPSTPQPIKIHNDPQDPTTPLSTAPALGFYSLGQLYQTPGWIPSLSLAAEVIIDQEGRTLAYNVVPMARYKVPTGLTPTSPTVGQYGKADHTIQIRLFSEALADRNAHATAYNAFRNKTAMTKAALPPLDDTTGATAWFNTLRTYYIGSTVVTQAAIDDAEVDYRFVKRYDRVNTLINTLFKP
ncbi:MAG: hypothetical protein RI907_3359 [Pseudomonadota bacterium]|jgi:hypothetical protein